MFKLYKITISALLFAILSFNASAQVEFREVRDLSKKEISAVGFLDYDPLCSTFSERRISFEGALVDFVKEQLTPYNFEISSYTGSDYKELVSLVRRGEADILYGLYSQTAMYEGIDVVYPSIISNPVTIITLPSKTGEVKKFEDIKKMKGAVNSQEIFTDFVNGELERFGVSKAKNSEELYKMLFTGEVDYVFSGYYSAIAETSKLGLRNRVSFSKQVVWSMPLFFGISKTSRHREAMMFILEKASNQDGAKGKMEQLIRVQIAKIESDYAGTVPPAYAEEKAE